MSDSIAVPEVVTLERLRFAAQGRLSPSVVATANLNTIRDEMTNQLVTQIIVEVQAQRIAEHEVSESREVVVETPATTWQMFKSRHSESWWLRWLVRRRPVRLTQHRREVTLTAKWVGYATFPNSNIVLNDDRLGAPVFRLHRSIDWTEH